MGGARLESTSDRLLQETRSFAHERVDGVSNHWQALRSTGRRRRLASDYDLMRPFNLSGVCSGPERHFYGDTSPFPWSRFNCKMTADPLDSSSHSLETKTAAAGHRSRVNSA